jgi:transcriptional regulator with XRE-family HTH domain
MCKNISTRIKNLRKTLGMSQSELASKLGLSSQVQLSKIENGSRQPTIENLLRLSQLTGESLDWIATGESNRKQHDNEELEDYIVRLCNYISIFSLTVQNLKKIQKKVPETDPVYKKNLKSVIRMLTDECDRGIIKLQELRKKQANISEE